VVASALMTGATVLLVERSVTAIQEAAPAAVSAAERRRIEQQALDAHARQLAPRLEVPQEEVLSALRRTFDEAADAESAARARLLSEELGIPAERVRAAIEGAGPVRTGNDEAVRRLGFYCLLVVFVFGIRYWFTRGQSLFLSIAAARLAANLRLRLFHKLQRLPVSYFNERRAGATQSVLTNDVTVYQTAVGMIRDVVDAPVKSTVALAMIFYIQWQLALVTLIFLPVMAVAIQRNGRRMRSAQHQVQNNLSDLTAMTNEALQGTRIVKAFAAEDRMQSVYSGHVEQSFESQVRAAKIVASLKPMVEFLGASALALVLYICGLLSFRGQLQMGQIAALIYALDQVNQGFRSLGQMNNTYNQVQAASERIYSHVLEVPEQHVDDPGAKTIAQPQGRIEFRNVSFTYPDGTPALRDVTFTIEPGSSLALVGPSGAGKSTIADLLLRFYDPTEGTILFDGIDIRELRVNWLRQQIGVVPQQTFLFAGSIEENIRLGAPDASREVVVEAAKAAHAEAFVTLMPNGFETELGERGIRVSGGEMQRIAIARALVRKPTVLLLDEATSALDATSEKAVTEALERIMRERTTLFIAHRLTTAARADQILYLRRGEVVEVGSHRDLMASKGEYAALFRVFSNGVLDETLV
jgi:ATP-binding cassette, subfamily B, bacterial MsbA